MVGAPLDPARGADADLYTERPADAVIRRALQAHTNVLVVGGRGAGRTSLLLHLQDEPGDEHSLYVRPATAGAGAGVFAVELVNDLA